MNNMSRAKRYSKKNRLKRRIKRNIKNLPKNLTKDIIYLITGFLYIIYLILKSFNNLVAKLFMRLPRIMKVAIIYLLIANLGLDVYDIFNHNLEFNSVLVQTLNIKSVPVNLIEDEPKEEVCIFDSISCQIAQRGKELGLTEEQILISIAISKWETGNYTSSVFKTRNNVGGVMCNSGLREYANLEEGITHFLTNLKNNYFDLGLDTLEKIQPKYCPVGASNDPMELNKNWLSGTNKMLEELISKK